MASIFSHLIFIFPPEQLDSLRQILHLKGQLTCQFPPILSHCPNIQRVSLGQLHLEIRSVKGESTLLPLILKLTVVALGFPSISFQKKSTSQFIKHPVETSNFDLQEISVEGWSRSGPAILLSRNILLVCTQRCPQLYTHRDPAIWQKSY